MIEVERVPTLRSPVLVGALSGWVDAGLAGAGAVAVLAEQLTARARIAHLDLDDLVDLTTARPSVRFTEGTAREIGWPSIDFVTGHLGGDVVVVRGPEPSLRWPSVSTAIVDFAMRLGVRSAFLLGGMPAPRSHRWPVEVAATLTRHAQTKDLAPPTPLRADYRGPTGFQTALQMELGDAGIHAVGLWAQVPAYLSGSASPPAISALVRRVGELTSLEVRLAPLDPQIDRYAARVEEVLERRPDVADAVRAIEAGGESNLPSGDELASEIERFLRDQ